MDGIVLLAKQPGLTSFSSLGNVKKALNTTKVGHTGTLDSFAQGLLVVCTGRFTRLAGQITEFDKTYKAVFKFGAETDTLEYTGEVIKTASLPTEEDLRNVVNSFIGEQMQLPPAFSAIHVNGQRASDLARKGADVSIPARKIIVYKAEIQELLLTEEKLVEACLIEFKVSKGTYIRSLARDIGLKCGSAAHLAGLFRTTVGSFNIENASGYSLLRPFNIASVYEQMHEPFQKNETNDKLIRKEILEKITTVTKSVSEECGFISIDLADEAALLEFRNGKPLKNKLFVQNLFELPSNSSFAVFYNNIFTGLINKNQDGRVGYSFVIN